MNSFVSGKCESHLLNKLLLRRLISIAVQCKLYKVPPTVFIMKLEISDFENVKVDIKEFIDFIIPSNKHSIRKLASLLYPEYLGKDVESLTKYLYIIIDGIENDYDEFSIKKKNGKLRTITKPNEVLADIQKRIYKYILKDKPVSPCAAAYIKGGSIRDATKKHIGYPVLLKLDINSFFESIDFESVKDVFLSLGFDKYQAITLANFCCYKGRLPQDTSTSPMLSNLVMREFDDYLSAYCLKNDIKYTRYSDDMLFSGDFDAKHLTDFVNLLLQDFGFELNQSKTKVIKQGQRQSALGVVLNEKQQVSKEYRKQIRQEIHYCSKYSVKSHLERMNDNRFVLPNGEPDYIGYVENLYGRINFALQINPEDMEMISYRNSLKSLRCSMLIIKQAEQQRLFECIYEICLNNDEKIISKQELYNNLLNCGFKKKQLNRLIIPEDCWLTHYDEVYLARDDKDNILSVITVFNGEINKVLINPYYDGFFGSIFDKSLGCLIITSDKLAAITSDIPNLVSFNNAPCKFFLSTRKLDMIKEYGNKVIVADCPDAEYIRLQMIANGIKVF